MSGPLYVSPEWHREPRTSAAPQRTLVRTTHTRNEPSAMKTFLAFVRRERAQILSEYAEPLAFCSALVDEADLRGVGQQAASLLLNLVADARDWRGSHSSKFRPGPGVHNGSPSIICLARILPPPASSPPSKRWKGRVPCVAAGG